MMNSKKFQLAHRIFLYPIIVTISFCFLMVSANKVLAATLKDSSIVRGEHLKLGDIFNNTGENSEYILGPAPLPGKDMVLSARTLYRIAAAMNIQWRPSSIQDQIVIKRAATIVSSNLVENTLKDELKKQGLNGQFNLIFNRDESQIILPEEEIENVEVSSIKIDNQKNIFEAVLSAPSIESPIKTKTIIGKIEHMVSVPVLIDTLRNGDIISGNDLEWITLPEKNVQRGMIFDTEDIIGLTPRRVSFSGRPLLKSDFERPQIVERGENVTLIFKEGALVLTAKGRALQNGAKGDLVRVTNINSNRSIDGIVTGSHEITVQ